MQTAACFLFKNQHFQDLLLFHLDELENLKLLDPSRTSLHPHRNSPLRIYRELRLKMSIERSIARKEAKPRNSVSTNFSRFFIIDRLRAFVSGSIRRDNALLGSRSSKDQGHDVTQQSRVKKGEREKKNNCRTSNIYRDHRQTGSRFLKRVENSSRLEDGRITLWIEDNSILLESYLYRRKKKIIKKKYIIECKFIWK